MILQVKCPCCGGDGGEYDAILWDGPGGGPYYECCFCKGEGQVGLWKRLIWLWDCQIMSWIRWKLL